MNKKILGLLLLILVITGVGLWYGLNKKENQIVTEVKRDLTIEEQNTFENKLQKAETILKTTSEDSGSKLDRYNAYIESGMVLQGMGKLAKARDQFLAAAKLDPKNYTAQTSLFSVYSEMNDYSSSRQAIKEAVKLNSSSPDIWRNYISLEMGQFAASREEANSLFKEALQKTNNHVDIMTVYAQFLEQGGDKQGAIDYWKKAAQANPSGKALYDEEVKRLQQVEQLETK